MKKSLRLNNNIRADILSNIMQAYSSENIKPVVNDNRDNTLREVLLTWYLKENEDIIKLYNDSPGNLKEFYRTENHFYYVNGDSLLYDSVYFSENKELYLPRNRDTFVNLGNPDAILPDYVQAVIDENSKLSKYIRKERVALSDYEKEFSRYKQDIEQVLSSVNTTAQLTELWPEVKKFLPKGISNPTMISLPSINIAVLNRKLGRGE